MSTNDIYLIGEVGYEITLESVINQVKQSNQDEPLNVYIHSCGGSVYDGLAIYNYLKTLPQEVNTISSGLVASIASVIFLAGNKETRKINSTDNFLIHLPSSMDMGNASQFEKTAKELRNIEDKISTIYENETNLTKAEAMDLMVKDEMLDVAFLKEKGFVNEVIQFKAVAKFNNNNNQMSEVKKEDEVFTKEDNSVITRFINSLGDLMKGKKEVEKQEPKNIIVKTASQEDLDFYEREEGEPVVGDKAKLGGADAEGSVVLASGETYVFIEGGKLDKIIEKEAEAEPEDKDAIIAELREQLANKESDFTNQKTELETAQAKIVTVEADHLELVNRLKGFASTNTVDTVEKVKKEINNKAETLAEKAVRMAKK